MAHLALLQFKISNDFDEWEKTFYAAQNPARKHGINSISHGHEADDPKSLFVLMMLDEKDTWSKFYENSKDMVESSGHILDSTKVTYYEN